MSEHGLSHNFTQTPSGLFVPEAGLRDSSMTEQVSTTASGIEITDTRRVTVESAEADFQKSKEALRAPLTSEEAVAILGEIQARATEQRQSGAEHTSEDEGDVVAAHTLKELMAGERQLDQKPDESTDDFLSRMSERFKPADYQEGDELKYQGYTGSLFYRYKRAQQLLASLREHPDKARVEYLGAEKLGAYMGDEEVSESTNEDEAQPSPETVATPVSQESRLHSYFGALKERDGERIHLEEYEPHTAANELPPAEVEALESFFRDAESVGMAGDMEGLADYANMEATSEDPLARLRLEYAAKALESDLSLQEMDSFLRHVGSDVFTDASDQSLSEEDRWLNRSMALLGDYVRDAIASGKDIKTFVKTLDEKAMTDGGANIAAGALEDLINKNPLAVRNLIQAAEKAAKRVSV